MRVIIVGRSAFANGYERTLARLIAILDVIMKNPSNPNFDQYIFESVSALIRCVFPHVFPIPFPSRCVFPSPPFPLSLRFTLLFPFPFPFPFPILFWLDWR